MQNIKRKRLRLKAYDYSENGAYFITLCTHNKIHRFGEVVGDVMCLNNAGIMLAEQWMKMINRFAHLQLDEYIVMPNHFHAIIWIDK